MSDKPQQFQIKSTEELRKYCKENPGSEAFYELASRLAGEDKTRSEAREICFAGLSANPGHLLGRLLLAKLFYQDNYGEFCVRELAELQRRVELPSLGKLLDSFGEFARPFRSAPESAPAATPRPNREDVVAEIDLDTEFDEVFEELDGEQ